MRHKQGNHRITRVIWKTYPFDTGSHRLVGLVVKASASRAEDPEFDSRLRRGGFSGSSHTSDLKIGTPVGYSARRLAL